MRTLEEAIKHFEEVAEKLEHRFDYYLEAAKSPKLKEKEKECLKCAKEHRQLVEWLKELKAYKDFEDKGYIMCRFEVAQDDRHRITKMVLDFSTKELFDNIVEVNADEDGDNDR